MSYEVPEGKVLILKTVDANMKAYGGFIYPNSGYVEASDFNNEARCSNGLHGFKWGVGNCSAVNWNDDAKWLVLEVDEKVIIDLGQKVKFKGGNIVFVGNRFDATQFINKYAPSSSAILGITITGGDWSTVTGGDNSTVTGGDWSTVTGGNKSTVTGGNKSTVTGGDWSTITGGDWSTITGGDNSTVTGGNNSTITGGDWSTVTGGDWSTITGGDWSTVTGGYSSTVTGGNKSTVTGGDWSTVIGGYWSTVTGGDGSIVTGGDKSTVTGGDWSTLTIKYYDGNRYRLVTTYVGEDGIKPNTPYIFDVDKMEWVEVSND